MSALCQKRTFSLAPGARRRLLRHQCDTDLLRELPMRAAARLLAFLMLAAVGSAVAQEKHLIDPTPPGSLNPDASAAAAESRCAVDAGQGTVRAQVNAVSRAAALDRRLFRRLPRRRCAAADHWTCLASHAAVAQPQLGPSAARSIHRTIGRERKKSRLEWSSGR